MKLNRLNEVTSSEPTCVREEQLRGREAKCHPQKMPQAPRPVDLHTVRALLGVWVGVEAHGAKETRQTKQVISMQVGNENLGDSTWQIT